MPTKAERVNEVFSRYLEELDKVSPSHREVIKSFPVYVGYIAIARLLSLYEMYKKVIDLPGHVGEVGSFRGASLVLFGKLIRLFESHNNTQAHGFDWFQGMAPSEADNSSEQGKWVGDYETLVKLVKLQELDDCVVIHKMDVTKELPDFFAKNTEMRFKLVFLDCGIREVLESSLTHFWPRLVPGGILVMDHYNNPVSPSESEVLESYIGKSKIHQIAFTRQPTAYIIKD